MQKCINCGAEYNKKLQQCPYCGMVNKQVVDKQHAAKLKNLKKEKARIKRLPQIIQGKVTKYLLIGALCLLAAFLVVFLFVFAGSKIGSMFRGNKEQKNIEVMEELLAQGDYRGFYDFYEDVDYAYAVYDKYEEIYRLYQSYERMRRYLDIICEYGGAVGDELIVDDFLMAMDALRENYNNAGELLNNAERLGNEAHLEAVREKCMEDFKTFMHVEDDVVWQIVSVPMEEEQPELYDELAGQMLDNLKSINFGREE